MSAAQQQQQEGAPLNGLAAHLLDPSWQQILAEDFASPLFKKIETFLDKEKKRGAKVFPPEPEIFTAFNLTPFDQVKVVVLGQDPYHGDDQGHGLSFSVKPGVAIPPSLRNIYKELTTDIQGFRAPSHGFLGSWAEQGVLMLNATLTVEAHKANSHAKCGWQDFTDRVIAHINRDAKDGVVFLLWGGFAQKKVKNIDTKRHRVIKTAHPSPLSVKKWIGCKCFSQVNSCLADLGREAIDWHLPSAVGDRTKAARK